MHHFVFYPVAVGLLIWAITQVTNNPPWRMEWIAIGIAAFLLLLLSLMLRQHYALKLQDRLLRMEVRFRYYVLTKESIAPFEARLSIRQLIALRFASDEELPGLLKRAANENLSPNAIKKLVKKWEPDLHRV